MADISVYLTNILQSRFGRDVRQSIHDAIDRINKESEDSNAKSKKAVETSNRAETKSDQAVSTANTANTNSQNALKRASNAEAAAVKSQTAAEKSQAASEASAASALSAQNSATAAENSANEAETQATASASSAEVAEQKATEAAASAASAQEDAAQARDDADNVIELGKDAVQAAAEAKASQEAAAESEKNALSYFDGTSGSRDGEETDNSKYYYEQIKNISQGMQGVLIPAGTINFAKLESQTKIAGYTYNIKDEFTTTDAFREGAGHHYGAGANVYWTIDKQWDILTPVMVSGVKGSAETGYRQGQVNLTPANLALEYHQTPITFALASWGAAGTDGAMKQTVSNAALKDAPALVVSAQSTGITAANSKTYMKNFSYLAAGYVTVANGSVTAAVFKKPTSNFTVYILQRY